MDTQTRTVKSKMLADALVWIGFEYKLDEYDNFVFIRTGQFDRAWRDLHYIKSLYQK